MGSKDVRLDIREPVMWFAGRMENKLQKNDHKGGWLQCAHSVMDIPLLDRLDDEYREMRSELERIGAEIFLSGAVNLEMIEAFIDECADMANFPMMLADKARELKKEIEEEG